MDQDAMRLALGQSARAVGRTAPNPPVGAVVVRDGVVIGAGHTQPVGGAHAEIMALRDCAARGNDPAGATMVVTLEPCGHQGRTPPCTSAILAAKLGRVVVGQLDPTEPMRGRSLDLLEAAGVPVERGVLEAQCRRSILGWMRTVETGLPEVTVKMATSVDGAIATHLGESQWITGADARAAGRTLRATHDAIVVGIETVLADNPRLTARLPDAVDPVPVVLDSTGRFPVGCALDRPETLVFTTSGSAPPGCRAAFISLEGEGRVDVESVCRALAQQGLHRVLVEGGGQVIRSFMDAGLVDTMEQFIGGRVLVGGRPGIGGPPTDQLGASPRLRLLDCRQIGADAWLTWAVESLEGTCSQG